MVVAADSFNVVNVALALTIVDELLAGVASRQLVPADEVMNAALDLRKLLVKTQ